VQSLGGATLAVFDLSTAQQLLDKEGAARHDLLASDEGVTPQQLTRHRAAAAPSAQVRTETAGQRGSSGISEGVGFIRYFLLGVRGDRARRRLFVIYNTLTITLAQRVREFATLRTLGASRKQIMRSVLLEGFALGVLASVIGLFGGVALAKGLSAVFDAMDLSMPQAGLVLATRRSSCRSCSASASRCWPRSSPPAGPWPSRRSRRAGGRDAAARASRRHGWLRPVTAVAAIVLLAWGAVGGLDTGSSLVVTGLGCLFMFVAFWLVSSRLVVPIASAVGRPSERIAGAAGPARAAQLAAQSGRTAARRPRS
jgi:putative ABC transport system permease protein